MQLILAMRLDLKSSQYIPENKSNIRLAKELLLI